MELLIAIYLLLITRSDCRHTPTPSTTQNIYGILLQIACQLIGIPSVPTDWHTDQPGCHDTPNVRYTSTEKNTVTSYYIKK